MMRTERSAGAEDTVGAVGAGVEGSSTTVGAGSTTTSSEGAIAIVALPWACLVEVELGRKRIEIGTSSTTLPKTRGVIEISFVSLETVNAAPHGIPFMNPAARAGVCS
ncbi:hypothetical protein COU18_02260 [Candidatus Kaiserbacteria bacterium CG10_big_fil_rev_8_21_14_0_10_51_14]|uniref:Uncharacterized protein n=1 Tax=Candidatus Kaiserbacteria bacterium CG10_big_fil_rev_8_21_14_0_10_51_14 TaxID=1974610 RepID=A0A2H0UDN2_9BACT|nr:MAG: hypothetical protein COU18_02260 [Candidatus Kaiserbacteria bacterium CG10_big_fil_rev_8_21_14_0_10_51_14]